jgi:hypothetical protein
MLHRALFHPTLLAILACLISALASADNLVVPVGQQGADKASLERPHRAMKAADVEGKFGAPLSKSEAVGTPSISNWEYPEYRVYFEGDRVLHSVLKPMSTEPVAAPVTEAPVQTPADAAPAETAPAATPTEEASADAPTPETSAEVQ